MVSTRAIAKPKKSAAATPKKPAKTPRPNHPGKSAGATPHKKPVRKSVKVKTKIVKKVVTKMIKEKKKKDPKRQESMKRNYHIIAWRAAAKEMGYLQKDSKDGFKKIPLRSTPEYEQIMELKQKKYFEIIANNSSARANEESRLRKAHIQLQEMANRMQAIEASA
jgi:hypothetical protein